LDEYERQGGSAAQFAGYIGIKYSTLANWIQNRRKQKRPEAIKSLAASPLRWIEAMVQEEQDPKKRIDRLTVYLPGGARVELTHAGQAALAAVLLRDLLTPERGC